MNLGRDLNKNQIICAIIFINLYQIKINIMPMFETD